jgi:hypothetical protein
MRRPLPRTPAFVPRRPKYSSSKPVGIFVPKLIRGVCKRFGFNNVDLVLRWSEIVGKEVGQYTRPKRIKWPRGKDSIVLMDGTEAPTRERTRLEVWVTPGKALNVEYGRAAIIERINGYFGYRAITELAVICDPLLVYETVQPRPRMPVPADAGVPLDPLTAALKNYELAFRWHHSAK